MNLSAYTSIDCRVCGEENLKPWKFVFGSRTKSMVAVYSCKHCYSFFTNPQLYLSRDKKQNWEHGIDYFLKREHISKQYSKMYLQHLVNDNAVNKRYLDIGCGIGWSLIEAQQMGFAEVHGVKPIHQVAQYAKDKLGLNVINDYFRRDQYQEDYFDLIMANQVLEHVEAPKEMLLNALRILKPGGLLMINIPPFDWLRLALYKLNMSSSRRINVFYAPEDHINYFSPKSFDVLTHKTNSILLGQFHWNKFRKVVQPWLNLSTGSFLITK